MLTRSELFIKWGAYGAAALALEALFALLLRDVRLLGVHLFLPPLLVGVVASQENTRSGAVFAMVCGVLCDLTAPGTFPCVYTLSFTIAALAAAALAGSVLQPGVLCSVAVTLLTFFIVDAFHMAALFLRGRAAFEPMASLALREAAVSCLPLFVVHPVMRRLHRRFTL